jgi:hypothetical protein
MLSIEDKLTPTHTHDCERCLFIESFEWNSQRYDIWFCPNRGDNTGSIICRHGSEGPEYSSCPLDCIMRYLVTNDNSPLDMAIRIFCNKTSFKISVCKSSLKDMDFMEQLRKMEDSE